MRRPRMVVLTGGPGAGKTAVLDMLRHVLCEHVVILPEAAGIVFGGGFPRGTPAAERRAAQRAIYHIQSEVETVFASRAPSAMLCDRGTMDGAAYWPEGPDAYWRDVGTTHAAELARYDAVVLLQTAAVLGADAYDGAGSNACRYEDLDAAIANANLVELMWRDHPRLVRVPACATLEEKVARVRDVLRALRA